MKKEFCRYAVWDLETGVLLVCGEKYKVNQNLTYEQSFRYFFRKVSAYTRFTDIKGRFVKVVFWFNAPKRKPCHFVTDAGLILGLR